MAEISFRLNGKSMTAQPREGQNLLDYLRRQAGLPGAKQGCESRSCGACTVIVNHKARRACATPLKSLEGAEVETIESLADGEMLHPLQVAFLHHTAVQCGFCTPGMIMASKALLDSQPDPSEEEIKKALKGNICRCTGYARIVKAVQSAAQWIKDGRVPPGALPDGGVGENSYDLEGILKVTGKLAFTDDLEAESMLVGKVVWTRHPHALITAMDTAPALEVPGVQAVLTADDVPGLNAFGVIQQDQPILVADRARFYGDALALVLADDLQAATKGAEKVRVTYQPLPVVDSALAAQSPNAPEIHEGGNVAKAFDYESGDFDAAYGQSAVRLEAHITTPYQEHAYLECESALARLDGDLMTVYVGTQYAFEARESVALALGWPVERVKVIAQPLGGAFGGKTDQHAITIMAALGAWRTGRPVKITINRPESLRSSTKRHPYEMDYRLGLDDQGHITALEAKMLSDAGPYLGQSDQVLEQGCIFASGPYRVPNVRVSGRAMYTNNAMGGAFRGYGINQGAYAMETLMDEAARRLNLDPIELRLRNVLVKGDTTPAGERLNIHVPGKGTLLAAQKAWNELELPPAEDGWSWGAGVATAYKNVGWGRGAVDDATARLCLLPDGRLRLAATAPDMGQGIRTGMYQLVRKVFGTDRTCVEFEPLDTSRLVRANGGSAERLTFCTGNAVLMAAEGLKEAIAQEIQRVFELSPDNLKQVADGAFHYEQDSEERVITLHNIARILEGEGKVLDVERVFQANKTYSLSEYGKVPAEEYRLYPAYSFTTAMAVVKVENATGRVKVEDMYIFQDVGKAINPDIIRGQLEGSCIQGLGYAVTESFDMYKGVPTTAHLSQIGLPTFMDTPRYHTVILETPHPDGPLGAKGISEVAMVPATPAVTNAITAATGVRIYSIPADRKLLQS